MGKVDQLVSIPGTQRATKALFTNALYTVTRHLSRGGTVSAPTEHLTHSKSWLFSLFVVLLFFIPSLRVLLCKIAWIQCDVKLLVLSDQQSHIYSLCSYREAANTHVSQAGLIDRSAIIFGEAATELRLSEAALCGRTLQDYTAQPVKHFIMSSVVVKDLFNLWWRHQTSVFKEKVCVMNWPRGV